MNPRALANFVPFLLACGEGCTDWLYLDQSELHPVVTFAVGVALWTVDQALSYDWTHLDGTPASADDVHAAWIAVNARPDLAKAGGKAFRALTTIRATKASVDRAVADKIAAFESQLRPVLDGYDVAPDKAQEGAMRIAWATGGARFAARWPKFTAAFRARDWATCAKECVIPGLIGEPTANELEAALFTACANGQGDYEAAA